MKAASPLAIVPLLLSFTWVNPLSAQFVNLIDAPFTATMSSTHNGQALPSAELARASNGSTYEAYKDADGNIIHIMIGDAPNHRSIELFPHPPSFTYRVSPLNARRDSVEQYRKQLQRAQDLFTQNPDRDKANGSHHHEIALGVEQKDGMTIFRNRDEVALVSGEKIAVEAWQSDLGFAMRRVSDSSTNGVYVYAITDLRRVEPDPKLFEIPAEYLPHPDPLLDGKKVFVNNETGIPEVKDAATLHFNGLGRSQQVQWTVVDSMEEADLVADFTNVVRTDDLDPPFEMKIHVPRSETILFVSHLRRNPNTQVKDYLSSEKSLVANYVSNLWNRIANTHIGLMTSQAVASKVQNTP